jgi:hypothetical protein
MFRQRCPTILVRWLLPMLILDLLYLPLCMHGQFQFHILRHPLSVLQLNLFRRLQ